MATDIFRFLGENQIKPVVLGFGSFYLAEVQKRIVVLVLRVVLTQPSNHKSDSSYQEQIWQKNIGYCTQALCLTFPTNISGNVLLVCINVIFHLMRFPSYRATKIKSHSYISFWFYCYVCDL